ncbi:hypothetical protein BJF78_11500 [Pseudonocardia sp. CNS-139]|nr:hypothetical protein BJF78_11500 [Pseudonocardia sp. CNS-139]
MIRRTAELLLVGGKVWTRLGAPTTGEDTLAVAIADGRILDVGPLPALAATAGPQTRTVDVGGRRVVPGLVDSHIHAVRAGLTYLDELDWTDVRTLGDALDSVAAAAADRPDGTWITVQGGWHPAQLAENRMPTRAELDAAAPRHPVFVYPLYGHEDVAVLNGAALDALGWTGAVPDPEGAVLFRGPDGRPDGRLTGLGAYQHIARVAADPDPERAVASSRAFFRRLAALGLTGVVDAAASAWNRAATRPFAACGARASSRSGSG